jgi:hypothetical protein
MQATSMKLKCRQEFNAVCGERTGRYSMAVAAGGFGPGNEYSPTTQIYNKRSISLGDPDFQTSTGYRVPFFQPVKPVSSEREAQNKILAWKALKVRQRVLTIFLPSPSWHFA